MKIANSGPDFMSAPANYADLFRTYHDYVVVLVRRAGIDPQHAEDAASEILTRFMERDFLAKFDPTLVFSYQGELRPARFKSFLTKFVILYARGCRDKLLRLAARELLWLDTPPPALCNKPTEVDTAGPPTSAWTGVEMLPPAESPEEIVVAAMAEQSLIAELRGYLATVPPRSRFDTCNLVELFDAMVEQVHNTGTYSATELRHVFGVSATAMHTRIKWMRSCLAAYLGRPGPESPVVRGRR